jgi:hypothetical protein
MTRVEKPEIPPGYVHQMQMQMECTGIDECEYVEFRFRQTRFTEWTRSKDTKGCFAVYDNGKVVYDQEIGTDDCQMVYWILQSIKEDFVPKDPNWLPTVLPTLREFWNEVVEHRKNDTRPPEKKLFELDL